MNISALIFRLPARNYRASSVFAGEPHNCEARSTTTPVWEYIGPDMDFVGRLFTKDAIYAAIPFGTFDGAIFRSRTTGRTYQVVDRQFRRQGSKHHRAAARRNGKDAECQVDQ